MASRNRHLYLALKPPDGGPGRGLGHLRQLPARVRSMAITEHAGPGFARDLCRQRRRIERFFASLCAFGGGLTGLPPWVRTYPRVHAWVQIKLIIAQLRNDRAGTRTPKRVAYCSQRLVCVLHTQHGSLSDLKPVKRAAEAAAMQEHHASPLPVSHHRVWNALTARPLHRASLS